MPEFETTKERPQKGKRDKVARNLQQVPEFDVSKFNPLLNQRNSQHISSIDENIKVSQNYINLVNEADSYLKYNATTNEQKQNKALVSQEFKDFKVQFSGSMNDIPENELKIPDEDIDFTTGNSNIDPLISRGNMDVRDWPLFPWKPCPADLKQGFLGDCWLESALANLAYSKPDWIENSLKDNGDGTVTGRIYDKYDNDLKAVPNAVIRYYRVEKTIPIRYDSGPAFSQNCCLWPEMIRKILAAHIRAKEGPTQNNGMPVTVYYRSLHGGDMLVPTRRIFEMLSSDHMQTVLKVLFNDIFKGLNIQGYEGIFREKIRQNIDGLLNQANIIYGDKYKNQLGLLCANIENDKNLLELLKQPIVRQILGDDLKKLIRLLLSKNCYDIIKDTFERSGGLMICALSSGNAPLSREGKAKKQKYLQNAKDIVGETEILPHGLCISHGYSILGFEEEEQDGQTYYFVKIRNPHGRNVRNDKIVNGEVIPEVILDNSTDGVGRIEILNFMKYFDKVYYRTQINGGG